MAPTYHYKKAEKYIRQVNYLTQGIHFYDYETTVLVSRVVAEWKIKKKSFPTLLKDWIKKTL